MIIRLLIVSFIMMLSYEVQSQAHDRFRNFHGIAVEGNHFFEAEGVEIFVRLSEQSLNEKGIAKMIKQYKMKGAVRKDTLIGNKAIMLVKKEMQGDTEAISVCYLLYKDDYLTTAIGFMGPVRNVSLEHFFVQAWLDKSVPESVYTAPTADLIDFIGRPIKLGGVCRWMSPHNVQCPNYGQMSWSVFDSEEAAVRNNKLVAERGRKKSIADIQEEVEVPVTFEGVQVKAKKVKVKIQVPKFVMGGSNVLIVYYITANVRNKYVSCVLSQYTDDTQTDGLAPLLKEVMSLDK